MTSPAPKVSAAAGLLALAIVLCVVEGCIRRWVLPGSSPLVQGLLLFSKDVPLALAAVLASRFGRPDGGPRRPLHTVLIAGSVLVVLGGLGAIDGLNPVGAVMTTRNSLLIYWAAFSVSAAMRGRYDVSFLLHVIGVLTVANAVLGLVQFNLPSEHWLNAMTTEQVEVVQAVGRVRVCGSFSYIAGMNDLAIIGCWAGATLAIRSPAKVYGYLYLLAAVICTTVTISRSGMLVVGVLLTLILASRPNGRSLAVVVAVFGLLAYLVYGEALTDESGEVTLATAVVRRHTVAGDSLVGRATGPYVDELPAAVVELPFGSGMGQGQTGGRTVASDVGYVTQYVYEGEPGRVVAEIGLIGFLGVYAIRLGVPYVLLMHRRTRTSPDPAIWWPSFWLLLLAVNTFVVFDHVQATFQSVALACLLVELARAGGVRR